MFMAEADNTPLVSILEHCRAAEPDPWYPSVFAREKGIERDSLDPFLDRLRMGGLVQLTEWMQGTGQGYRLTREGERVLQTPRELAQLSQGRLPQARFPGPAAVEALPMGPVSHWDRGETVRAALLEPGPGRVSQVLLAANIGMFLLGLLLASRQNLTNEYIRGFGNDNRLANIQHQLGALTGADIVQGQWWKLLTSCFVHFGVIHLFVNMYALYALGPATEQMWGRWRFLLIYLVAGLGGSCAVVWNNPASLGAGASGAIWGVMTSYLAWIFLNRGYLPGPISPAFMRNWLSVFLINVVISMMPGISAAAHFSGGAVGVVAAWLVNTQRFEAGWRRTAALLGIVLLPVLCIGMVYRERQTNPRWMFLAAREKHRRSSDEIETLHKDLLPRMRETMPAAKKVYDEQVVVAVIPRPERRDAEKVKQAIEAAANQQARLASLAKWLNDQGPFTDPDVADAWSAAKDYVGAGVELFRQAQRALEGGAEWKKDDAALAAQKQRFDQAERAWKVID
ncbi:hypothetical protein AYO44_08430 [Planctomycetaceae bacterium SCGC AG-212-F19]|nr:hypothetical protein AYO44_08430 [Planctomycetaceae bacterium SCGC AG-212-F19]